MIDILMPYRPATPQRVRLFNAMRIAWGAVDFPVTVCVGRDGDQRSPYPFNLARAANQAFWQSTADIVILHGADHIPPSPQKLSWVVEQLDVHPWVPLYAGTRALGEMETERVLTDVHEMRLPLNPQVYHPVTRMPHCTGIMAFRREAWTTLRGMDERFEGWGCEDTALRLAAEGVFGPPPLPGGDLTTLHHARASRDRFNANAGILASYITAHATGRMVEHLESR